MFELTNPQMVFYGTDKAGVGQAVILCGSVLIPRVVDEAELQHAANEIFRINDGLRTQFIEKDEKVYQEFKPFKEESFKILRFGSKEELDAYGNVYATIPLKLDIRSEGSGVSKNRWKMKGTSLTLVKNVILHTIGTKFKQARYRIKTKPACCDIQLVCLPDACGAIVKMHHSVSDAWTMLLVANQFVRLLNGESPEAYAYEDFVKREEVYRQSKRYTRDRAFFEQQHDRCPEPTLLWPKPVTNLLATRRTVTLEKDETARIKEYAAKNGTSPYILFLTAMSIYMSRKLNRDTLYVGSVVINRSGTQELNTAGMFINAIPLLVEFSNNEMFSEAIVQIQNTNFSCFRHEKGCQDNSTSNLLYDMWVSYQTATLDADPTAICTQYYCDYAAMMKILTIEDRSQDGRFKLHFDHNLEVPKQDIDEMFRVVLAVLRDGIADDTKKLTELGI